MRDAIVTFLLVFAFAAFVTAHVAVIVGLFGAEPRWRGLVALVVPPLGPYWAWRVGMKIRAWAWIGSLVVYALARALAGS